MPFDATSNANQVAESFRQLADSFRFRGGTVGDSNLGRDVAAKIGVGIAERSLAGQSAPDGKAWDANKGKYGEKKQAAGLPIGAGFKSKKATGRPMLSLVELQGEVEYADDDRSLIVRYGTSDAVRRKAQWFTVGSSGAGGMEPSGAKNQPPRPFYGLDDTIRQDLKLLITTHFKRVYRRIMGRRSRI